MLTINQVAQVRPKWKPSRSRFKSVKVVTHDFWFRAFVPGLTQKSHADSLLFRYEGEQRYLNVRVTDVAVCDRELVTLPFGGATYELRGRVTFVVADHAADAETLSRFFSAKLLFCDELVVHCWRSLGDFVQPPVTEKS